MNATTRILSVPQVDAADLVPPASHHDTACHEAAPALGLRQVRRLWRWIADHRFLFVSLLVHLLAVVLATAWIVQGTVARSRRFTFAAAPPPPQHSLVKVKEYQVQMARQQRVSAPPGPRRVTTTGLSKVTLPDLPPMPSLRNALEPARVPGMDVTGGGIGPLFHGSEKSSDVLSSEAGRMTSFGFRQHHEGLLTGTFYDLKQTPSRQPTAVANHADGAGRYYDLLRHFVLNGWNTAEFDGYLRAKTELYASQLYIPIGESAEAPRAFDVDKEVSGACWVVLYQGKITPPCDGTFRFVGRGDNVLVVRLNGKNVFDGSWGNILDPAAVTEQELGPCSAAGWQLAAGQWFEVHRGVSMDMQVIIGDSGGAFSDFLFIAEKDFTYESRSDAPDCAAWPLFQLAPLPLPEPGFNEHWQGLNPEPSKRTLVFAGEEKADVRDWLHPDR